MILIWFSYIDSKFYCRYYKRYIFNKYYVGYRNSYGYEVVQMIYLVNGKCYSCSDYDSFIVLRDYINQNSNLLKKSINAFLDKLHSNK